MEFKDIVSISGLPGLHQLVSSKGNGIIVKSLEDGKSQFVSSRLQGVSSLDNIAVFLKNDETIELSKVLREMQNKETEIALPDAKADSKSLQNYFSKIIPEYDAERVHTSDMKKMVKWYHLLKNNDLIPKEEVESTKEESTEEKVESTKEESTEEKVESTKEESTEEKKEA